MGVGVEFAREGRGVNVEHRLTIRARCPVDPDHEDVYETTISVHRVLPVEEILGAIEDATSNAIFQEDLTRRLAVELSAHVVTVGEHSGVKTTCQASG